VKGRNRIKIEGKEKKLIKKEIRREGMRGREKSE
jgi:hypothetical protein